MKALRWLAGLGTLAALAADARELSSLQDRQEYALLALVGITVAALLMGTLLLRRSLRLVFRNPDLLVPLGLLVGFDAVFELLLGVPFIAALLQPSWALRVLSIGLGLSLAFVLTIASRVFFAGWTTLMLLQLVTRGRLEPLTTLRNPLRWLWRTFALEFLGWGVLLLTVGAVLSTLASSNISLAIFLIGAFALIWNFSTAALLPIGLQRREPLVRAIRTGIGTSLGHARSWGLLLLAQMMLLGGVVYLKVGFVAHSPGLQNFQDKTDFSVNAFWIGGYESSSRWYTKLMQVIEAPELASVTTLLMILLTVLAIAVKLEIISKLHASGGLESTSVE